MIITNVGSGGVEVGYAPFPTVLKVPGLLALSSIREEPIIDNGVIAVDKVLTIFATVDHRFGDATRAVQMMHEMQKRLENPEEYLKIG